MLKKFTVNNFLSFQKENSLDLTAGTTEGHSGHLVDFEKVKILKSAVMYGANASGKSNLIKAIKYGEEIILKGLNNVETYKKYFRLDNNSLKEPTEFEFELELNKQFFSYGFSSVLNTKQVLEEWLYEIGKEKPIMIFERKNNDISLGKPLLNQNIKDRFEIYKEDMKNQNNQLFLSEIASKDLDIEEVKIINDIYNWFEEKLIILFPSTKFSKKQFIGEDEDLSKLFKKYLNEFDTGIIDIKSIEEDFEIGLKNIPETMKKAIEENSLPNEEFQYSVINTPNNVFTIYKDENNDLKVQKLGLIHSQKFKDIFELENESDGTRRLFDLIPLIGNFSQDYTIIIDEFDRSLHPKLTEKFFELFYQLNNLKTQLIVTTHESTLLNLDLLRRDEIWFLDKNDDGGSNIFSLNKFTDMYDSKLEKAYLLGRYGALPIFKSFNVFDEMDGDN